MKNGNGFLSLRCALSLAAVFACMLWATAQYAGSGKGASAAAEESAYKDYAVVCSGPSNVWLAGESGSAAGVSSIGADGAYGLALHDDGSVTCVSVAGSDTQETSESRFPSLDDAAAAGLAPAFACSGEGRGLGAGQALRHAPSKPGEAVAAARGGRHCVALWADGSVSCEGDIRRVPARVRNAVAVGASPLNVWALSADGAVDVWGDSFPPGGLRVAAKGPAVCEIVDVRVTDSGLCLLQVRARKGLLEGDADGDGVPAVEEAFLLGTDPLRKDTGAYAPAPDAAEPVSAPKHAPAKSASGRRAAAAPPTSLYSMAGGATYYADASRADDSGDGLSWESAKRTIQAAADAAQCGDTVLVTNGVYSEGTRITPNGLFQNRLVIANGVTVRSVNGAGATVIQGSGAECYDTWDAVRCVFIADGALDGFTLQGGAAVSHWSSPEPRDKSGGCLCMGEATAESEARNCIISGGMAYDGGGVWGGRLVNCLITGCNACWPAGADQCALLSCTVTANGSWYWNSCGGARGSGVTNSVIYGNTGWESPNCNGSAVFLSCSDPDNFGAGNVCDSVVFADPLFADAANGDFRLQAQSPCIDAGGSLFVTAETDLSGAPRVQGGAADMGAYEFPADTDGDGVQDSLDAFPQDAAAWLDTDGDGMPDELHRELNENTTLTEDTDDDSDGLADGWEVLYGLNPLDPSDAALDSDGDWLTNQEEFGYGTAPTVPDTDGDGLGDGAEVYTYGTNPSSCDTDCDGMSDGPLDPDGDGPVIAGPDPDPTNPDTDGDLVSDGSLDPDGGGPVHAGPDAFPYDPAAWRDTDCDGFPDEIFGVSTTGLVEDWDDDGDNMADAWEQYYNGFDTKQRQEDYVHGSGDDPDGDGLTNQGESECFADPFCPDTDNDGISDGLLDPDGPGPIIAGPDPDPINPDMDGDLVSDGSLDPDGGGPITAGPDAFPYDPAAWRDTDGDGAPDEILGTSTTGLVADAFPYNPDACLDTDGDGYPDFTAGSSLTTDAFPLDAAAWRDTDGDGAPDELACPSTTGLAADAFPGDPTAWLDTDGDGYPDFTLAGSSLTIDAFPLDAAAWRDTDGDGRPDELLAPSSTGLSEDLDDDNDCMPDAWENVWPLNSKDWTDSTLPQNGVNGLCEMWESKLYMNCELWRENGGVGGDWPRVTFALSGAVGSPSPATLVIGGQEFPLEHRGQGFSLLIPPGRTLALELRDAPGIAVAVTSESCIVLGGDLYYNMLFCVSDPVFATLHAPRLTLGDGSGKVCIHGEGQAVCASVSSNLCGDIAWTQGGQTVGTGLAVTSSALSQGPLTATFQPAGGNGVPCSAQTAVGFCKLCRCEHGLPPPQCAQCHPHQCPSCGRHLNTTRTACPCMDIVLPDAVPPGQPFSLLFGYEHVCEFEWTCDDDCCPEHLGQSFTISCSFTHRKKCKVDEVRRLETGLPSEDIEGQVECAAHGDALSVTFDDAYVVGHVVKDPPFDPCETFTGSVTVASIGIEAGGPFSANGNWLVRGGVGCSNEFSVSTVSDLNEGSVRLSSDGVFFSASPWVPEPESQSSQTDEPPGPVAESRTFWLGASVGGVTPGLSYALLRPQGYALIVSNLAVEAVMIRLPTNAYYVAYGSAAPLQVALDPVSHDPDGYGVLVDGAVAACSNQPPFYVDTSALDVGVHTVTVRCNTFTDLEASAPLYVVKVGIDPAETNLAWTVLSSSIHLSWEPCRVPNDTVSWSVSPYGLSFTESSGDVFTFSPTNSSPGEYTVTAASTILPECTTSCVVRVIKVQMAMDGNRDGEIDFNDPADRNYLFWVNDDCDIEVCNTKEGNQLQEDDASPTASNGHRDWEDNHIGNKTTPGQGACLRDLEDFTRLHIKMDPKVANMEDVSYWLRFDNWSGALPPAVNVFSAVTETEGYLTSLYWANKQILELSLTPHHVYCEEVRIDSRYIMKNGQTSHFLLEGCREGVGDLAIVVKKGGQEICKDTIRLTLKPIAYFYDIYSVTASGTTWNAQVSQTAEHPQIAAYQPKTGERFLLVHGWNTEGWEKRNWAETTFKRLWWKGYQGSVALFDWPTLYAFDGWWDVTVNSRHFDNSEFISWQSAEALAKVLTELNGGGALRVFAHSMGNVAMTEALRKFTGPPLYTYIAAQAAISAQYYDWTTASREPAQYLSNPDTPDIIGHYDSGDFATLPYTSGYLGRAQRRLSYHNYLDYALTKWAINNNIKPDSLVYQFKYHGSITSYDESNGDDYFYRGLLLSHVKLRTGFERDRYQIFAYCEESRSCALGQARDGVVGFSHWDLNAAMGYDDQHYSHSREFRSNVAAESLFWETVVDHCDFDTSLGGVTP